MLCSDKASSKVVGNHSIRRMDKGTNQKDDRAKKLCEPSVTIKLCLRV